MKVWLAGSPKDENKAAFDEAAQLLVFNGHEPAQPFGGRLKPPANERGKRWQTYMRQTIAMLLTCDGVALLPGWTHSREAVIEYDLARKLEMPVRAVDSWVVEPLTRTMVEAEHVPALPSGAWPTGLQWARWFTNLSLTDQVAVAERVIKRAQAAHFATPPAQRTRVFGGIS